MLLDKNSPLFLKWASLPKIVTLLENYLGYANDRHFDHYGRAMSKILYNTVEQYRSLAKGADVEKFTSYI
jgi:hypothetical protein